MEKDKLNIQKKIKTYENIEQDVLEIKKITLVTDKEETEIIQIRFLKTDDTEITYKPKNTIEKKGKIQGISTLMKYQENIGIDEIPEKIFFLNNLINEHGKIRLLCDYTKWNSRDKENKPITYHFFRENDFYAMYPIDDNNKEIREIKKKK